MLATLASVIIGAACIIFGCYLWTWGAAALADRRSSRR